MVAQSLKMKGGKLASKAYKEQTLYHSSHGKADYMPATRLQERSGYAAGPIAVNCNINCSGSKVNHDFYSVTLK